MYENTKKISTDLHLFLGLIGALLIIGLLFIYSSSSVFALERCGSSFYFLKKQLYGFVIGMCSLIFFNLIPLTFAKRMSPYLFLGALFLTILTLVPSMSSTIHGSSRWLVIGQFSFQPSELLKIAFLLYSAHFLSKKESYLGVFKKGLLPYLCIIGITALVLLKQPDFGMAITIALTGLMLFFTLQWNSWYILCTVFSAIPIITALIIKYPYRLKRIMSFLNPWADPQGSGFQIIQSLIAIGSGSFWGVGIAHSKQKFFYLPMAQTDFIFSIIAEETGFFGATLLITLYVLFLYVGFRIAWSLKDLFSTLIVLGFVLMTSLQTIINFCVTTGLLPTKGIGLPFISYGNSALVCSLAYIGLIMNCVKNNQSHLNEQ